MKIANSVLTEAGPISVLIPPETQMMQPHTKDFAVKIIYRVNKSLIVEVTK
jgi:hypothetical protein